MVWYSSVKYCVCMSVLYHNIYLGEVCDSVDVYVHPMKDCDVTLMQVSMTQLESEE